MPSSHVLVAKRALVKVLLSLATAYRVVTTVTRESADHAIVAAYKRLLLKVHPDKGGSADTSKITLRCDESFFKNGRIRKTPPTP